MLAAMLEDDRLIVCQDYEDFEFDPKTQLLMDVSQVAICGSDFHIWEVGSFRPDFVPGHEVSGIVSDPGPRADLKLGDRVTAITTVPCYDCRYCREGNDNYCDGNLSSPGSYVDGALMEQFAVRADLVRLLPANVSDCEGAMVEPLAVALHAVRQAGIKPGDKVLITGAGAIGAFVAEFCAFFAAGKIVITDINQTRLDKLRDWHPEYVTLNGQEPELRKKLEAEAPEGYDIYFDCVGKVALLNGNLTLLKRGGCLMLIGIEMFGTTALDIMTVITSGYTLKGCYAYTTPEFDEVLSILADKQIDFQRYAGAVFPLKEVQAAFELLADKTNAEFKIFVSPAAE